jgi:hypothetical protein
MSLFKTSKGILCKVQAEKIQSNEIFSIPTYGRHAFVKNWEDLLGSHILFGGNQQDLNESAHEVSKNLIKFYNLKCEEKVFMLKSRPGGSQVSEVFNLLRQRNKFIVDAMNRCLIGFPLTNLESSLSI